MVILFRKACNAGLPPACAYARLTVQRRTIPSYFSLFWAYHNSQSAGGAGIRMYSPLPTYATLIVRDLYR